MPSRCGYFQAPVTSVHAVFGAGQQRCWTERQLVNEPAQNSNAIGSNVGTQSGGDSYSRDVQRCQTVPSQTPDSWDVTYNFRGYEHRIQTSYAPGPSISVNHEGMPRQ